MAKDPELFAHQEWLGYLQPAGLVVSPPALLAAQAFPSKNIIAEHARFLELAEPVKIDGSRDPQPAISSFRRFVERILEWEPTDWVDGADLPASLEVALPEYHETLRPTAAVPEYESAPSPEGERKWIMLIQQAPLGLDLDEAPTDENQGKTHAQRWQASPQARFERLLRETQVPIGLLGNGTHLRLIYAPRGESAGHLTFPVRAMTEVSGRPIFAALRMLLGADRLFSLPDKQRLPAILAESRKYQNSVSTKLAGQVLTALYELLRGFQAANDQRGGELLRGALADDPNQVYAGLLTVLLRLVFSLYAEDRSLMSGDEIYQNHYSVTGLFERLRHDAGRHVDTMDSRYGAWAQLLTLFRLVHDGGRHGGMRLPMRRGYLFDPDRYPFLEGRALGSKRSKSLRIVPPRVSDGVVFRVLSNLLILDGERLSYRTLDVEQIGSVYETMMGFHLEVVAERSIAIKPKKPHGAPATIGLESLLAVKSADRTKWLKERTDQEATGQALTALKDAQTIEDLLAALEKKIDRAASPNVVPPGGMAFQPSDERRKSGSHYTPRSLTEPIVRTTLRPILERLGPNATPEQILDLKVCDPAMGSGAFLVEACRQLAEALVKAWHAHNRVPSIPPDEDEILHARRIVATRCLYGVDKNPMAVDLAKMSLWLATLAKDHPFTFLDHALRCGDSLVGLSRKQIAGFHWKPERQRDFARHNIEERIRRASEYRREIRESADATPETLLSQKLSLADEALGPLRFYGDLVVSAFFAGSNDKQRKARIDDLAQTLDAYQTNPGLTELRRPLEQARRELLEGEKPVTPFHWELEFPEVFDRENSGFDAFVGNPPFAGKNTLIGGHREGMLDWLKTIHEESHGNADLVAHFFRRSFDLLRKQGSFGLIATNTIGQGDTRSTGLRWICTHGGTIYDATRRKKWPGLAAVIVSIVHVRKGLFSGELRLEGRPVPVITAYLFHAGGHDDPAKLRANEGKSFVGSYVLGMGFTFDDTDSKGVASSLDEMRRLIANNPRNAERIFPFIGGEEVNDSPNHSHHRYVINFEQMSEKEAMSWPDLMRIVETKVKGTRGSHSTANWWHFERLRYELYNSICFLNRVLAINCGANPHAAFTWLPSKMVFSHTLNIFAFTTYSAFASLQSRPHEVWARFFGSSMKDDLRYTPSDCFETFPFPPDFETNAKLEAVGQAYYEFRADLMVRNNQGMTKTYNRFHDPDERSPDILQLRELHAAMDRAALDAYGWTDLRPTCEFLLDYEEDEDDDENGGGRRRKKPWRYRWPDDLRDEVLARLLELNRQRAEEERLSGLANEKPKRQSRAGKTTDSPAPTSSPKAKTRAKPSKTTEDENPTGRLF